MLITLPVTRSLSFGIPKSASWLTYKPTLLSDQSDWCDNMLICSYNYAPVLPVSVSRSYFSTRPQGARQKFGLGTRLRYIQQATPTNFLGHSEHGASVQLVSCPAGYNLRKICLVTLRTFLGLLHMSAGFERGRR